jgi:signal peptidase I
MTDSEDERPLPRRHALVASILSLIVPGSGLALLREPARGWGWFGASTGLGLILTSATVLIPPLPNVVVVFFAASLLMLLAFNLLAAMDTWRIARAWLVRPPRRWFRSGLVSIPAMLLASALLQTLTTPVMGWRSFSIPSASMQPTLQIGDYLLIDARDRARLPRRGDVIVFTLPTDDRTDYIKRTIGLPGDRVQIKSGRLILNGTQVPRRDTGTYLAGGDGPATLLRRYIETLPMPNAPPRDYAILEASDTEPLDNTEETTVPEGHLFVLGDNRDNSRDSRLPAVGLIPIANIIGPATTRFWARDRARILDRIE